MSGQKSNKRTQKPHVKSGTRVTVKATTVTKEAPPLSPSPAMPQSILKESVDSALKASGNQGPVNRLVVTMPGQSAFKDMDKSNSNRKVNDSKSGKKKKRVDVIQEETTGATSTGKKKKKQKKRAKK